MPEGDPDQDDLGTFDETLQVFQERNEALRIEVIRLGSGEQARFPAIPPKPERRGYRCLGPMIAPGFQDRRFPSRYPVRRRRKSGAPFATAVSVEIRWLSLTGETDTTQLSSEDRRRTA